MLKKLITVAGWGLSAATLSVLALAVLWALWLWPATYSAPQTIMVERGQGLKTIARDLEERGIISSRWVFKLGVLATGLRGELKAGEYELAPQMSMQAIASQMAAGRVVQHAVQVIEGQTVLQVKALLEAEPLLVGEVGALPLEGALEPDTYYFTRGDSRRSLLERMKTERTQVLDALWAKRPAGFVLKDKNELLVLASIVEKETGIAHERAKVAGVFFNRLRLGMKLQSDPTALYVVSNRTGQLGRALTRNDLQVASPYNTYYTAGLPPAPIAIPSRASLEAVLAPEKHDFIYFVADGTGGHVFAKTLDEHNRNVAKWRAFNRQAAE